MRHLWMGNVPPRLGGVRVYEKNTHDDEVTITQSPTDIIPIIFTTIYNLHAGGDRLGPDVQRRRLPRLFSSKHAL